MPRVLRIINRFNLGGPTYNVAFLTRYMSPEFETLLVGGSRDETEEASDFILNNMGVVPVIIPEMNREISIINDIIAYKKIRQIIKDFKPDIVHTHASKAGCLGRWAAYRSGVPVIVHTFHGHVFHSYFNSAITSFYKTVERRLATKTTKIIALSEKQKEELSLIHNISTPDKFEVIPLGFDLSHFHENIDCKRAKFRNQYLIEDDEIVIVIVGRLVPIKNHNKFLESIKFVTQNSSRKIRAFIVGDGECRASIEEKAKELELDFVDFTKEQRKATLTFTSWIKKVDEVYAGSDIVTLTSLNEGTPVSLIEAQAANKPILTTQTGGIENVVMPNITAKLSNNGDFKDILLELVQDEDMRYQMSLKGWDFVKDHFHYTRLVKDMSELYFRLLNK